MTVEKLIKQVSDNFEGELFPNYGELVAEYNRVIRSLMLILPAADSVESFTPHDGKLDCKLLPKQIRRVFAAEYELLPASRALLSLLPDARLYHAAEDGIYVTVDEDCIVYYRSIPEAVSDADSLTAEVPLEDRYTPILKAWLTRYIYLSVGDFESANAYGEEYNRLLEEYKRENGVAE